MKFEIKDPIDLEDFKKELKNSRFYNQKASLEIKNLTKVQSQKIIDLAFKEDNEIKK